MVFKAFNNQKRYSVVYWDIVGRCMAHCKYCFTGNGKHPEGREIDVNQFSDAIAVLKKHDMLSDSACMHLYVWGEPTLHSKLGEIIAIIQKNGLHYMLSSNFGQSVDYQSEWFIGLDGVIISMCGFSQESYNRIHKLDFDSVKRNIIRFVRQADASCYDTEKITVAHHLYQFNIEEIPQLLRFTRDQGISYHPYYASLGDLDLTYNYIHGKLSPEEWIEISSEVFGNSIMNRYLNNPKEYCRQFDRLVLDEECNVLTCCCLPRSHPSSKIVNVFDPDLLEILSNWIPDENCIRCIGNGLCQYDEKGAGNFDLNKWIEYVLC